MVNVIVCGKFHYGNYLRYFEKSGFLERVYYSHRLGTSLGVSSRKRKNLFLKEYCLGFHLKVFGERSAKRVLPLYHKLWGRNLGKIFAPAKINLFLLHGNCVESIRMSKEKGSIVIGEAVNAHPKELAEILSKAAGAIGMEVKSSNSVVGKGIIEELKSIDYLLCPSRSVADSFSRQGFPAEKIWVIPYGIDSLNLSRVALRLPNPSQNKAVKIVCVGQVTLRKGQHLLLQSLAELSRSVGRKFDLTLVGRQDPSYLMYLRSLSIPFDHIRHIPHPEIIARLSSFDVFILPSIEDGFGVAAMEAASAGVPVVVSKYSGVSELFLQRNARGYVYDPFDTQSLVKAMTDLLSGVNKEEPELNIGNWEYYSSVLEKKVRMLL